MAATQGVANAIHFDHDDQVIMFDTANVAVRRIDAYVGIDSSVALAGMLTALLHHHFSLQQYAAVSIGLRNRIALESRLDYLDWSSARGSWHDQPAQCPTVTHYTCRGVALGLAPTAGAGHR